MKSLSIIILAILSCGSSLALGETDIYYQEADGTVQFIPPTPVPVDNPPPAAVEVVGEIRSIDEAKKPRLWGDGRPGTVRYGQSGVEKDLCVNDNVEFGLTLLVTRWETISTICPTGTWVCTVADIDGVACTTARTTKNQVDYYNCSGVGIDWATGYHQGWLANAYPNEIATATGYSEGGNAQIVPTCQSMPVWCCSEYQP